LNLLSVLSITILPKIQTKKAACDFFQQAALFDQSFNFLQQITARLLDFIPQATTNDRYVYGLSAS
jgi:hypothetical protein